MKKRIVLTIGIATAAFSLATGMPVLALTAAHKTLFTKVVNGDCSACHWPTKGDPKPLFWKWVPSSGILANYGYIGAFCAEYCHGAVPAYPDADATATALYGASGIGGGPTGIVAASHGLGHVIANRPANTWIPDTLRYGGGNGTDARDKTGFECTTCHNPHKNATVPTDDASEALLHMDIDALCDECHTGRGAGDGTWIGYGKANAMGSHPVGVNVTTDSDAIPDSPIDIGVGIAAGASPFDDDYGASGAHNLGGHLINGATAGGGVTCVTCHAVHGMQPDGGETISPVEDLLVIRQGVQGTAEPAFRANGAGDNGNALCQGCHANGLAVANSWNPGNTAFSHPSSGHWAARDAGVGAVDTLTATAQSWPFGSANSAGVMDVGVICESCHAPHPTQDATGSGYGAQTNSHILRAPENTICNECHTGSMANHHPVARLPAASADNDIAGADGDTSTVSCADCHSGAAAAHNWYAATGLQIKPLWEPADNGWRVDITSHAGTGGTSFVVKTSKECIDCHFGGTNTVNNTGAGTGPAAVAVSGKTITNRATTARNIDLNPLCDQCHIY